MTFKVIDGGGDAPEPTEKEAVDQTTLFEITYQDKQGTVLTKRVKGIWYESSKNIYVIKQMEDDMPLMVPLFGFPAENLISMEVVEEVTLN